MAVVLSEEAYRRITRAVRHVEKTMGENAGDGPPQTDGAECVFVRCTSSTPDGLGDYPGVVTMHQADTTAWVDFAVCVLRPANSGVSFASGERYLARPAGARSSDGKAVFVARNVPPFATEWLNNNNEIKSLSRLSIDSSSLLHYGLDFKYLTGTEACLRIAPASTAMGGVVTVGAQTLKGPKTFIEEVVISKLMPAGGDTPLLIFKDNLGNTVGSVNAIGYANLAFNPSVSQPAATNITGGLTFVGGIYVGGNITFPPIDGGTF